MKKFINYNIVMFKVGSWFTKFFMLTIWPFCAFILFVNLHGGGSLVSQGGSSWIMIAFICLFGLFYPIRNFLEVTRVVEGSVGNPALKDKYRKVLEAVTKQESK